MALLELVQTKEWMPTEGFDHSPKYRKIIEKLKDNLVKIRQSKLMKDGADVAMSLGLFEELVKSDLFILTVPEKYGGIGANNEEFVEVIRVASTLGACVVITAVPHLCNGVKSIEWFGCEEIRKKVFSNVQKGRLISFALTEDHTGSNVSSIQSTISKRDNGYSINGSKLWVTNVPFAGYIVLVVKSPELSPISNGATFVLVPSESKGLTFSSPWDKLAANGSPTVNLYLDDVQVTKKQLLGEMGKAIAHFNMIVGAGRLGTAAGAVGLAQRTLQLARMDAADLRMKNDLPADDYDCFLMLSVLRYSAFLRDRGHEEHDITTALCKMVCTQRATTMVQAIFDWYLSNDLPVNVELKRILRELPFFKILEGPTEVITLYAMVSMVSKLFVRIGKCDDQSYPKNFDDPVSKLNYLAWTLGQLVSYVSEIRPLFERQNVLLALAKLTASIYSAQCIFSSLNPVEDINNYRLRAVHEALCIKRLIYDEVMK